MNALHYARLLIGGYLTVFTTLACGVSGHGWESEYKHDPDYAVAVEAVQREDWSRAIAALEDVVARRDWDDDAYTLLGFAYRKLGDYPASFTHYRRALELNPYHRGALEYLGEAYLESGERRHAAETLERLESVCRRINAHANAESWKQACPEWHELDSAIRSSGSE